MFCQLLLGAGRHGKSRGSRLRTEQARPAHEVHAGQAGDGQGSVELRQLFLRLFSIKAPHTKVGQSQPRDALLDVAGGQ